MNNISEATKELWRDSSPSFLRRVISMRAQKVKLISAMKFIIFLGTSSFLSVTLLFIQSEKNLEYCYLKYDIVQAELLS